MEGNVLIHIGYHKTGTSWMQDVLFKREYGFNSLMSHGEVDEYINKVRLSFFNEEGLSSILRDRLSDKYINVISSEILSGSPLNGGIQSYENVLKIKKAFPKAKILVVIRNQEDFLDSIYSQYVKTGGIFRFSDFVDFYKGSPSHVGWDIQHILYSGLISSYLEHFGAENVCIYQYENFRDKTGLYEAISDLSGWTWGDYQESLAGVDKTVNRSVSRRLLPFMRLINYMFRSYNNPTGFIESQWLNNMKVGFFKFLSGYFTGGKKVSVSKGYKEAFKKDNVELERLVGDLNDKYIK